MLFLRVVYILAYYMTVVLVYSMTVICVYVCYVSTVEFDFSLPGVTSMSLDPHKVCV